MSQISKVSREEIHTLKVNDVPDYITKVQVGMLGNVKEFPDTPFTQVSSDLVKSDYLKYHSAFDRGGIAQKPDWIEAQTAAIKLLDDGADYTDEVANGDPLLIIRAGYTPTHYNPIDSLVGPMPPHQPQNITIVKETNAGEIIAFCEPYGREESIGCIICQGEPLPAGSYMHADGQLKLPVATGNIHMSVSFQRIKTFIDLTPEVRYYIYFYATNTHGTSPLSEVRSILCR